MAKRKNKTKRTSPRMAGVLSVTAGGSGFVAVPERERDILIPSRFLNTALHGDRVEIVLFPKVEGERREGEIVAIRERVRTEFVGTVQKKKKEGYAFVLPDDPRIYTDFFLPPADAKNVRDGNKVVIKMVEWDDSKKNPVSMLVRVLGPKGDHDVEIESIVYEHGLLIDFPPEVTKEAQHIADAFNPTRLAEDHSHRRDLRDFPTITIDPVDAKDFDDAISLRILQDGLLEVGVHVADVGEYVQEDSAIDREARNRGFSVYLVDRTVPMLPEVLSNKICSLVPGEDRLAFSVLLTITPTGEVRDRWFGKTVIHSDHRFVYREAQDILDGAAESPHATILSSLADLARLLREQRFAGGAIDFDRDEIAIELDKKGKSIAITVKERLFAHIVVEELMILANREVAALFAEEKPAPAQSTPLYRVHDAPDPGDVERLAAFVRSLGYRMTIRGKTISPRELMELFAEVEGKPEEFLVKTAALRSMSKAEYAPHPRRHFGLALDAYMHFTSPIRRYADLMTHRALQWKLQEQTMRDEQFEYYGGVAEHLSVCERRAVAAERESVAYKQVEYMLNRTGETFEGIISGIANWGIFIEEVTTKADGLVHVRSLDDDYYEYDEGTYALVGQRTGKRYRVGDTVKIMVAGGNIDQKQLDYTFV